MAGWGAVALDVGGQILCEWSEKGFLFLGHQNHEAVGWVVDRRSDYVGERPLGFGSAPF